ncbi:hydroxymethylbilane synthase [Serinibacter arcticus]|uniref:Hydroxymethylbilane synthase n=1 Tax=Serinibacter arcticus TaxID=1655435 RepID=A0A2U1ZRR7_9MICO|nr:hydroxymethylbilane synthase [Serinibacter arcticus]PWD49685.1 hydroxymethylbilane synthase [Serinibacter arcticus]
MTPLRIGTRASALALTQTTAWASSLGLPEGSYELVRITSEGDRSTASLASLGGTGVFVSALREALLAGQVDVVVHSCKDLPTAPADGIDLVAVPPREDQRDALVAAGGLRLEALPEGAVVGTGSPRRRAQLRARRPDLLVVDIRGNVDTRLRRVLDPTTEPERRLDAVVLAAAGLARLGRSDVVTELLELEDWPTAPAQGALAVEMRADADPEQRAAVAGTDHAATRTAIAFERDVLRILEAGCAAPLGVSALPSRDGEPGTDPTDVEVVAGAYSLDGARSVRARARLGSATPQDVVTELLAGGAEALLR